MPRYANTNELLSAHDHATHTSDWVDITQDRVAAFADATDDHQWIHVDAERSASGPFGGTIAHGYLTLALLPRLLSGALEVDTTSMHVNYGLESVRFTNVVPIPARVRATSHIRSVKRAIAGLRVGIDVTVEIEGIDKPALRAHQIVLLLGEET